MPVGELLSLQLFLSLGRTLCRQRLLTPHNYLFYLFPQVSSYWSSPNSNTSAVCFLYAAVSALGGLHSAHCRQLLVWFPNPLAIGSDFFKSDGDPV